MLSRISNEIVRIQKDAFGKGPDRAKSYLLDDFLMVVMRGGVTTAEQTMLHFGHQDLVRSFRQTFENEMTTRMVDTIEQLTRRKVVNHQSQIMFAPHIVVEMFFFDREADEEQLRETAEGQLTDRSIGEVRAESAG